MKPADTSSNDSDFKPQKTETGKKKVGAKPKTAETGVGMYARELLKKDMTNTQVLEAVSKRFPDGNTSQASIAWYRNDMRNKGEKVLSGREVNAKHAPAKKDKAGEKSKAKTV